MFIIPAQRSVVGTSQNRSVFLNAQGCSFRTDVFPERKTGELAVDVRLAGICETDLQLVDGYMEFGGILGHEFVGIAREGALEGQRVVGEINCACHICETCQAGMPNHCPERSVIGILNHDGAFSDRLYLPAENLHPIPDAISNEQAVFTEPLAAAFQICRQVDLSDHSDVVVVGDGRLAYLIAQALRQDGPIVRIVGKHEEKLAAFRDIGFDTHLLSEDLELPPATLAVDCTGSVTGIPTALRFLKPRGTLVLKTTIHEQTAAGLAQVVIDEIQIIGSRCGPFDVALEALQHGSIETDSLISARFPIEEAVSAFDFAKIASTRKVLLDF